MNLTNLVKNKKIMLPLLLFIGVILIIIPSFMRNKENKTVQGGDVSYYSELIEKKLEKLISSASGVGDATVVVTIDGTSEYIYAKNTTGNSGGASVDYVIVSDSNGESGVLLNEIYPSVRGVAVVCDGGNSAIVKEKVTNLISSALGIPTNRITVAG